MTKEITMAKVTIRTEWMDRISDEPLEVQNEVCGAIFLYQCGREVAGLSEAGQRAFAYIRRFVDEEKERRERLSQKRSEAACKRWSQDKSDSEDHAIASEEKKEKDDSILDESTDANALNSMQMHEKRCNCIENDANACEQREVSPLSSFPSPAFSSPRPLTHSTSSLPPVIPLQETTFAHVYPHAYVREDKTTATLAAKNNAGKSSPQPPSSDGGQLDIFSGICEDERPEELPEMVRTLWNRECRSFPKIIAMSAERKSKVLARSREIASACGTSDVLAVFAEIFGKIEASDFLKGGNERGWVAAFDWVIANGTNWVKVMEGTYDGRRSDQRGRDAQSSVNASWEGIEPLTL